LYGLVLFVSDSLPSIFLSHKAISSSSFAITGITTVQLRHSHCIPHDAMQHQK
jgi:hypothetical protein